MTDSWDQGWQDTARDHRRCRYRCTVPQLTCTAETDRMSQFTNYKQSWRDLAKSVHCNCIRQAAAHVQASVKALSVYKPLLQQLHWLRVKQRVQYKLCTIMYTVHYGLAPSYITELVSTVAAQTSRLDCVLLIRQTTFNHGQYTYKIWRTRLFVCWLSSLELATRWTLSNTNDKQFQTQA